MNGATPLSAVTCTTGASITVTAPPGVAGHVLVRGDAVFGISHFNGQTDIVGVYLDVIPRLCDQNNAGNHPAYVGVSSPTDTYLPSVSLSARFPIAAGATQTFYLDARTSFQTSGFVDFNSAAMDAEFNPD